MLLCNGRHTWFTKPNFVRRMIEGSPDVISKVESIGWHSHNIPQTFPFEMLLRNSSHSSRRT